MLSDQERIDLVPWLHEFDFGNGLRARSVSENLPAKQARWNFIRIQLDKINFTDRSVLDIGCWDGYWSFYSERRGARKVLASDDATQNWAASAGLELAKELFKSNVDIRKNVSVYELDSLQVRYDLVLFMGVYYHLVDPFFALAQIRHRVHEESLVVVEGDFLPAADGVEISAARYDLGNGGRCFEPSIACLRQMLEAAYFEVLSVETHNGAPQFPMVNRVLLTCRPIVGANQRHPVRPPFGLSQYDPRYAT